MEGIQEIRALRFIRSLSRHLTPPIVLALSRKIAALIWRHAARPKLVGQTRLHLACGNNILAEWANVDMSGSQAVVKLDLTQPLPISDARVNFIYSEHFIEHIGTNHARDLVRECYRVLQPGGVLRLSTPSLKKLVDEYVSGKLGEWHDVGWEPSSPCRMVNEAMRLWGHQFIYDGAELKSLLEECGFREVTQEGWRQSKHPELQFLECRPFHDEIILEAVK